MDQFKACVNVIESYSGTPGEHPGITKEIISEMPGADMSIYTSEVTSDQDRAARKTAREQYLAYIFISGACNVIYGAMTRYFHNEYLKDKYAYPKTFEADLKYMNNYQTLNNPGGNNKPHRKNEESGLVFAQHGEGKTTGKNRNTTRMADSIVSAM